jgi:AAA domain
MASPILEAARHAFQVGLVVVPTENTGSKAPDVRRWKVYQTTRPSVEDMRTFNFAAHDGLGIIAGAGSGYRECWDFDTDPVFLAFVERAHASGLGDVIDRLIRGYLDRTPGGGRRIIAKYPHTIAFKDITLARRPGREDAGEPKVKTLIELPTFAIIAPSNGRTHPSGKAYERLHGGFDTIASYTEDERTALMGLAKTFDEMPRPEVRPPTSSPARGTRPGDDYNRRTTWSQILEPHGWTVAFERDDMTYWRRPAKTVGVSATTNYGGSDLLYVFSSSTLFDADRSYSRFAAFTILNFDGDYSKAALALFKEGYGDDPIEPEPSTEPNPEPDPTSTSSSSTTTSPRSRSLHLKGAFTMTIRPVRWLWEERIPAGTFVLMGGREGIGKSIVAYTLIADLTTGKLPGLYAGVPKAAIVSATEDSWEHVIVPRLMAAGADLARVFRADIVDETGTEVPISLPKDTAALLGAIKDVDAALVLFDPLLSRVDARLDTHVDAEVRRALEPLTQLADAAKVTVLGLIHVNKTQSLDALTLLMGSRAFTAVARAVLFVAIDPDDEEQRLLSLVKSNLGRLDLPMLKFKIRGALITTTAEGDEIWTGQLRWTGESQQSIRDVLKRAADQDHDPTAVQEAADWLTDYVTKAGGTVARQTAVAAGRQAGHSPRTLDRARHVAGIQTETRGFPRTAYWLLPSSSRSRQTSASSASSASSDNPECWETDGATDGAPAEATETPSHATDTPTHRTGATGAVGATDGIGATESQPFKTDPLTEQLWQDSDERFKKGFSS